MVGLSPFTSPDTSHPSFLLMKTLTIREVENGYVMDLSCDKEGSFNRHEYVVDSLPEEIKKIFDGKFKGKKITTHDERQDMSFSKAMGNALKSVKDEKEDDNEDEDEDN